MALYSLIKGDASNWFTVKTDNGQYIWLSQWEYDRAGGRARTTWWYQYDLSGRQIASSVGPQKDWMRLSAAQLAAHNAMVEICYRVLEQNQ